MENRYILLHLSLIEKIGPAVIEQLVSRLVQLEISSLKDLYSLSALEIARFAKISEVTAQKIVSGLNDKKSFEKELAYIKKFNISWMSIIDLDYPDYLKNIHLPPTILYFKGDKSAFSQRSISIVGARKADSYGAAVVKKIVPELTSSGWVIVSGGARGVDTLAHKHALAQKGRTIAVLGSGLLCPYPIENSRLFDLIAESGGLVVSSFPLTMFAAPANFPARNRIIAGLSKACVVVQAGQTSGALITAQYALEQGKEVCAVPGDINNPLSIGCHKIISQGAHLVTCAEDIRSVLGDLEIVSGKNVSKKTKIGTDEQLTLDSIITQKEINSFDSVSEKIVFHCAKPISFDELRVKIDLPDAELQDELLQLNLDGKIKQNFMGLWEHD